MIPNISFARSCAGAVRDVLLMCCFLGAACPEERRSPAGPPSTQASLSPDRDLARYYSWRSIISERRGGSKIPKSSCCPGAGARRDSNRQLRCSFRMEGARQDLFG
ncbi:hypothetical protein BDZ45DRAFT_271260 [Acephala macrosclerotiorum]|nr:hypothetical protein BDZ45DRAFT_271260 [Acephala macrosclerotiorum]